MPLLVFTGTRTPKLLEKRSGLYALGSPAKELVVIDGSHHVAPTRPKVQWAGPSAPSHACFNPLGSANPPMAHAFVLG